MTIQCLKCKAWDMAAKENGYWGGMCEDCFRKDNAPLRSEWGGIARCITSDGRNINMADELNRLEREKFQEGK